MPVNFFELGCKSKSNSSKFGLCDDPPPNNNPAYISDDASDDWIATVFNEKKKEIQFFAIDNCLDLRTLDGRMESRCEGVLKYDVNILRFVELKSRISSGWLGKGLNQIQSTYLRFQSEHDTSQFQISAQVCNNMRPTFQAGYMSAVQRFVTATGLSVDVGSVINV